MDSCSDIVAAVGTVRLLSPCGAVAARHPAGREVYAVGEGMRLPDDDAALDTLLAGYVARMTCRDERALEALYDSTLGRVHAMALRIVGRRELAEEVVEDTYFQAWRRAADYDAARGRVLAWLLTICRSRALDALRRADPAEPHEDPAGLSEDVSAEADPLSSWNCSGVTAQCARHSRHSSRRRGNCCAGILSRPHASGNRRLQRPAARHRESDPASRVPPVARPACRRGDGGDR